MDSIKTVFEKQIQVTAEMRRLALFNDSMNLLHCREHSLVCAEEEIAKVQDTLTIKQMDAIYREFLIWFDRNMSKGNLQEVLC